MTVFGICMVRDAEDIIGTVVEHMMNQVDHVIVADNLSKDSTRKILDSLHGNITVIDDNDPSYRQSEKMTALADIAYRRGADYVIPFDADEFWVARDGTLKDTIELSGVDVLEAQILNYIPTAIDNEFESNPIKRIQWRLNGAGAFIKVACVARPDLIIHMGNHDVSYTENPTRAQHLITVRHFPWRTAEQFAEKAVVGAAALELTDLPYSTGQHWRDYARIAEEQGNDALKQVFREWFFSNDPYSDPNLLYDPVKM